MGWNWEHQKRDEKGRFGPMKSGEAPKKYAIRIRMNDAMKNQIKSLRDHLPWRTKSDLIRRAVDYYYSSIYQIYAIRGIWCYDLPVIGDEEENIFTAMPDDPEDVFNDDDEDEEDHNPINGALYVGENKNAA